MKKRNVLLTIEYDGTNFSGWQRQPSVRTVQGELERVLSVLCAAPISINGTSRTDAGVHALGQRASFEGEFGIPIDRIALAANSLLAENKLAGCGDVRIIKAEQKPADFHARFDCKGKKYIYKIRCAENADVFLKNYRYQLSEKLDTEAMREAAAYIVGTHDFKCFQAAGGEEKKTTVRTVYSLEIKEKTLEDVLDIDIEIKGDGFLYNMVRIITGTLVEVGLGKRKSEELKEIIESCDRCKAGYTAPPQGLYLAEVYYEDLV